MDEYIERKAAIKAVEKNDCEGYATWAIKSAPAADVVTRDCYDRILWENDVMRQQLADIGKAFAEKMDDVVERKYGKWVDDKGNPVPWDEHNKNCPRHSAYCSECGEWLTASDEYPVIGNFCPNCGADMREES